MGGSTHVTSYDMGGAGPGEHHFSGVHFDTTLTETSTSVQQNDNIPGMPQQVVTSPHAEQPCAMLPSLRRHVCIHQTTWIRMLRRRSSCKASTLSQHDAHSGKQWLRTWLVELRLACTSASLHVGAAMHGMSEGSGSEATSARMPGGRNVQGCCWELHPAVCTKDWSDLLSVIVWSAVAAAHFSASLIT